MFSIGFFSEARAMAIFGLTAIKPYLFLAGAIMQSPVLAVVPACQACNDDGKGKTYFAGWGGGLKELIWRQKKLPNTFCINPNLALADSTRAITSISPCRQAPIEKLLMGKHRG
jgi:hypothetical protein